MVSRDKVRRELLLSAEIQKTSDPELILHAAHGRTADLKTWIDFLYRLKSNLKELEVLLHVGVFPESGKIRFIPYLDRPVHHTVPSISVTEVRQRRFHQIRPLLIALRRRDISLPVKDRLRSGSQRTRHETKLEKGLDPLLDIAVHHAVQISEVIAERCLASPVYLFVDAHRLTEKTMTADMLESDLFLNDAKLVLILFR